MCLSLQVGPLFPEKHEYYQKIARQATSQKTRKIRKFNQQTLKILIKLHIMGSCSIKYQAYFINNYQSELPQSATSIRISQIHIYYQSMRKVQVDQGSPIIRNNLLDNSSNRRSEQLKTPIFLGVCGTVKKLECRPMKEILSRIKCKEIQIVQMAVHLHKKWDAWPRVDALICFYSKGFPYLKAWQYIEHYHPFLINNYNKQQLLWDRSVVYSILKKLSIPTPEFFLLYRDPDQINRIQKEAFGQVTSCKEFHVDYNNHSSQLPIKQDNSAKKQKNQLKKAQKDSVIHHNSIKVLNQSVPQDLFPNTLRVLYKSIHNNPFQVSSIEQKEEEIIINTKLGPHKFKKPFVEKPFDALNHFIRIYYPESMGGGSKLLFDKHENQSSRFQSKQNTVRKDKNYIYQNFIPDSGFIIKVYTVGINYMHAQARKSPALDGIVIRNKQGKEARYPIILTSQQKLICKKIVLQFEQEVCGIQILRSQQGKSYVLSVNGWSLAKNNAKYWDDCASLLTKKLCLHFFPHITPKHNKSLNQKEIQNDYRPPINHKLAKVQQLRSIVIICRHADRSPKEKLKIKTKDKRFIQLFNNCPPDMKEIKYRDSKNLRKMLDITNEILTTIPSDSPQAAQFMQMKKVLESGGQFEGLTHKIQLKVSDCDEKGKIKKIVIVLKWGGELSFIGYEDAIQLGRRIRNERYKDHDVLNLYSSYQHDLKTYSSEEGRCIKTAAAFLKGFLNLEGELPPIITSMVIIDRKAQRLLDCTPEQNHSALLQKIQTQLTTVLNSEQNLCESFKKYSHNQQLSDAMIKNITEIGSPRTKIEILYKLMKQIVVQIQRIEKTVWQTNSLFERVGSHQYLDDQSKCEDILLIKQRWNKLVKDFYQEDTKLFNISKIPQIYDTAKHDQRKNKIIFNLIDDKIRYQLKKISKKLAYFIVPNEVGITDQQKIINAKYICTPLLQKVLEDMSFWKMKSAQQQFWKYRTTEQGSWRHLRTRLYFTSASHLYSLLHLLTLSSNRRLLMQSNQEDRANIRDILYMGYLSHIEFKQYQNLTVPEDNCCRFRIEISISYQYHKGKPLHEFKLGGNQFYFHKLQEFLQTHIEDYKKNCQLVQSPISFYDECE